MDIVSSGLKLEGAQLVSYAASTAKLLAPDGQGTVRGEIARLRRERGELRRFVSALRERAEAGETLSGAEEWLADNLYLIERESKTAFEMLKGCPVLRTCGGESLTFALCRALLRAGGGKLTEERLLAFLDGFQTVCVLRQSELASLGAMLRCAIVSAIAEVERAMRRAQQSDNTVAQGHAQLLSALFAALRTVPLMDLDTLTARVNVPGLILELDPTGEYPRMDALSKKSYLGRLERMAAARETDEQSLARALIERAKREGRHVGFFLFPENGERKGEAYIAGKTALTAALALLALYLLGPVGALLLLPLLLAALLASLLLLCVAALAASLSAALAALSAALLLLLELLLLACYCGGYLL